MNARNVLGVDAVMIDFVGALCLGLLGSLMRAPCLLRVLLLPFDRVCWVGAGGLAMSMSSALVATAPSSRPLSLLHRSRFRGLLL